MKRSHKILLLLGIICLFILIAILTAKPPSSSSVPSGRIPGTGAAGEPTETTGVETALPTPAVLPQVAEYDLGEATITQEVFPEDSRFRKMPVRLNGIISVPEGPGGSNPVVLILHGNHPGCPVPEGDTVDRWPCDPSLEQPNYRGFGSLAQQLAAKGYLALSININSEYTLGYGEPVPLERLNQVIDLHLQALAEAARGGENKFGVDLKGKADLSRLALIGHSQGGEGGYLWIQKEGIDQPDAFQKRGYGPAFGLLMVAPSGNWAGGQPARIPVVLIQPACDHDVINQEGQLYYEINRKAAAHPWVSSVWLDHANHNYFNEILSDETRVRPGRPDCDPILDPENQRGFLAEYSVDFLAAALTGDESAISSLGMDLPQKPDSVLFGQSALVAALAASQDRLPILLPAGDSELSTNLTGGTVKIENVDTRFCEEGYYTPTTKPGSEPCKRVNLVIPGNPAMLVVSWSSLEGKMAFSLPRATDLSAYRAVSLRAAIDPLSPLNETGAFQGFTIRLTDREGKTSSVPTRSDEPALRFPEGVSEDNYPFEGGLFTGRVPMTSIRVPLEVFRGVDLAAITEIALLFDQTSSGSIFLADLELVR